MRTHFNSLFDARHLKRTILLFLIGIILIIVSLLTDKIESLSMISILAGIILLFFSVLHPWRRAINYSIFSIACIGISLLIWILTTILDKLDFGEFINDNLIEGVLFLFCIPGILTGIIGTVIWIFKKK